MREVLPHPDSNPHRLFSALGLCGNRRAWLRSAASGSRTPGCSAAEGRRISRAPSSASNYAALSPDGTKIIVVGGGSGAAFWDAIEKKSLGSFPVHRDHGRAVAFSPDGQWAASGSDDIVLFDASTRKMLSRLEYPADVWNLVLSPDNRWLVSTHGDGAVLLWDVMDRRRAARVLHKISNGARRSRCGSLCRENTTGAVAEQLHRRWLAFEVEPKYVETSRLRFGPEPNGEV